MTLDLLTFGCRLDGHESEAMRDLATRAGVVDTILVDSCAVTAEAGRQARQAIRRAHRDNPAAPAAGEIRRLRMTGWDAAVLLAEAA